MDLIPFPFFPKLCWIFSLSSSYSNQIVLPMAGANSFSALLSLLVVLSCIMVGQVFKPLLADSRQGNLAAGGWYFSSPFLTMICFVKTSLPHSFRHSICPPPSFFLSFGFVGVRLRSDRFFQPEDGLCRCFCQVWSVRMRFCSVRRLSLLRLNPSHFHHSLCAVFRCSPLFPHRHFSQTVRHRFAVGCGGGRRQKEKVRKSDRLINERSFVGSFAPYFNLSILIFICNHH